MEALTLHLVLIGGALVATLSSLWWTVRHREKRAANEFAVFLVAVGLWAGVQFVEILGGVTVAYYASFGVEIARGLMAVTWFYFTVTYAGHQSVLESTLGRVLVGAGTAYLLLVTGVPPIATRFTFETIHVVRDPLTTVALLGTTPFHYLAQVVGYVLVGAGTVILGFRLIETKYARQWQVAVFLCAVGLVVTFDIVSNAAVASVTGVDYAVVGTAMASVVYIVALYRGDLFGFVPVAREHAVRHIDEGVVVVNPDGRIIDANQAAQSLFETSVQVGETAETALPAPIGTHDLLVEQTVGRTTVTLQGEGPARHYEMTVSTLEPAEAPAGIVVILRDVTDREEYERELEQYKAFVEQSSDLLTLIDEEGRIEYANPQTERTLGYSESELCGANSMEFIHPEDRERVRAAFEAVLETPGETVRVEYRFRSADGEWVWLESRGRNRLDNPAIDGVVFNQRDVTAQKERSAELRRQNERLEQFASFVSHDLRNPLNVAQGRLALVAEEVDSEHLAAVERAHDRMAELIDDSLALARAGTTVSDTTAVDPSALANACWQTVATASAELETDADVVVRADESRLRQLIENLVRNAVEHGGEAVSVRVGGLEDGFFVADDGPGIPEDRRETVFESGYSTGEDGAGIGLTIVKTIADAHGWDVEITTSEMGGARFEFTDVSLVTDEADDAPMAASAAGGRRD
ncbi:PAS domain S-box protein [Halobellus clavatus]|uniref:histidine kinase n=1 Tax=Halobellus clavatus TaxID=660517 RepID=A0A1H3EKQ1_9EURY|nr:PAS domain S-box protein [Halobellus clavatus]SDX79336.1 PAS domain S-box-containing protein [Halobellus clavatus]